jgi:hypothetical protein
MKYIKILVFLLVFSFLNWGSFASSIYALNIGSLSLIYLENRYTIAFDWGDWGRADETAQGAARGSCQEGRLSLLPLVSNESLRAPLIPVTPNSNLPTEAETLTPLEQRWGRTPGLVTAREHPTFWFYIPQPPWLVKC